MTITYANGKTLSGIILSRRFGYIRVAVQGCEDVVEFTAENGMWSSEDFRPIQLEFAWERQASNEVVSEADCICPKGLASRLIQLLRSSSEDQYVENCPKVVSMGACSR